MKKLKQKKKKKFKTVRCEAQTKTVLFGANGASGRALIAIELSAQVVRQKFNNCLTAAKVAGDIHAYIYTHVKVW